MEKLIICRNHWRFFRWPTNDGHFRHYIAFRRRSSMVKCLNTYLHESFRRYISVTRLSVSLSPPCKYVCRVQHRDLYLSSAQRLDICRRYVGPRKWCLDLQYLHHRYSVKLPASFESPYKPLGTEGRYLQSKLSSTRYHTSQGTRTGLRNGRAHRFNARIMVQSWRHFLRRNHSH